MASLQWADALLHDMRQYESLAAPTGYPLSELDQLMHVGCAAISLESALSACRFGPDGPVPGMRDRDTFAALNKLRQLCQDIRLSRHAETQDQRTEAMSGWAVIANAGWGWAPGETTLPNMAAHATRLGVLVEMLRKAITPPVEGVKSAQETPVICSLGQSIYRVGNSRPYEVSDAEDAILQAFLRRPAMSEKTLTRETKNTDVRTALMRLREKYDGSFAAAIGKPEGKSSGGYYATVRTFPT